MLSERELQLDSAAEMPLNSGAAVLLVEPDPDRQWKLAKMLAKIGRRVIATSSCDGAVAFLGEYLVNLVLIAEQLPKTQGRYLAARLRKLYPNLRVIVLGDSDADHQVGEQHRSGVFEFRIRPFQTETLAELLGTLDSRAA